MTLVRVASPFGRRLANASRLRRETRLQRWTHRNALATLLPLRFNKILLNRRGTQNAEILRVASALFALQNIKQGKYTSLKSSSKAASLN
ncbi:MAG: hypothetical protein V7L19_02410 [Nostoc sp.]